MSYGYQEAAKSVGVFGKNNAVLTKFEYNPNGGKGGTPSDCIDIIVKVDEKEYRKRYFPVTKAFVNDENGNRVEITDPKHAAFQRELKMLNAELTDLVTSIVPKETVQTALETPMQSFKDFAQTLERLVKGVPGWDSKNINVFLEYQWAPSEGYTRTFLQLPKNTRQGRIFSADTGKTYKEVRTETSLRYIAEDGETHPFSRGTWYVQSNFANITILDSNEEAEESMKGAGGATW